VQALDGYRVEKLLTDEKEKHIIGVQANRRDSNQQPETLFANLVVDASGRGSRSPKWLTELGYSTPEESIVTCGAGYATRLYQRTVDESGSQDWIFITPEAPKEKRLGAALPVEEGQWIVGLAGWHGDHAPSDEEGFIAFAKSLPAPDVYDIVSRCTPLSDIVINKFPSSIRRHYEKLPSFPEGYLVLGDAMCSFNPLYGQGMTTAALQASTLDSILSKQNSKSDGIAKTYFRQVAKIIEMPWQMATGEDFRFPQTKGKKAPGTDLVNSYVAMVHRATLNDPIVGAAFLKVMNMIEPPTSLFHPQMLYRVFRNVIRTRSSAIKNSPFPKAMAST
jgi:2-polyprenyl-6-methoxyphenol hydroxylase-like FAD-dependent oxidoreductase